MKKIFNLYLLFAIVVSGSFFVVPAPAAQANGLQSVVQDGYLWRNDNGDEQTATSMEPQNTPAYIPLGGQGRLRMALSDPGISELPLGSLSADLTSAVVDANTGHAFFGTNTAPAQVYKVRLSDFSVVQVLTMPAGQNADYFRTAVINPIARWAAFGTYTTPATIQVIDLDTMMPTAVITMPGASNYAASVIDLQQQVMMFGTDSVPAMLSGFSFQTGFLPLQAATLLPINNVTSAAIDESSMRFMFGTNTDPATVAGFSYNVGSVSLDTVLQMNNGSAASNLTTGTFYRDPNGAGHAMFGSDTMPGKRVYVNFADYSVNIVDETVSSGFENYRAASNYSMLLAAANGLPSMGNTTLLATGDDTPQARIENAMGQIQEYHWPAGTGGFNSAVSSAGFNQHLLGSNTTPASVHRIYMNPVFDTALQYALLPTPATPCDDGQLMWTQVPASANGEAWEMIPSRNIFDGTNTTDLATLTNTGAIFSPGKIQSASSTIGSVYMTENGKTELEYSLRPTSNAETNQHYCFRVGQPIVIPGDNGPVFQRVMNFNYQVYGKAVIGTKSGGMTCPNDGVEISMPAGGEVWPAGGEGQIFWSTRGCSLQGVTLSLSLDGGATYPTVLAEGIHHANGFLFWDVPVDHPYTDQARIKIDLLGTGGAILATDESELFTIDGVPPTQPEPSIDEELGLGDGGQSGGGGPSCLPVGGLLKGSEESTVYHCGSDGKLHPFPNVGTYNSWYGDDFSAVEILPQSSIDALLVGNNVTYKPGVRMLKTVSDNKTYYVDHGGVLRWVVNEAVAAELYGPEWNQYIDDIPQALFDQDYRVGDPLTSGEGMGLLVYDPVVSYGSLAISGGALTLARDANSNSNAATAVSEISISERPELADLFFRLRSR